MSIFMGFCIGVLIGALLGAIAMYLFIKETAMDRAIEISEMAKIIDKSDKPIKPFCKVGKAPEIEEDTLDMPQEVKYGEF